MALKKVSKKLIAPDADDFDVIKEALGDGSLLTTMRKSFIESLLEDVIDPEGGKNEQASVDELFGLLRKKYPEHKILCLVAEGDDETKSELEALKIDEILETGDGWALYTNRQESAKDSEEEVHEAQPSDDFSSAAQGDFFRYRFPL